MSELIHSSRLEKDFISAMKHSIAHHPTLQAAASREAEWT